MQIAGKTSLNVETSDAAQAEINARIFKGERRIRELSFRIDASYTKLRELSISLELPSTFASRFNTSAISLALTGRNLKTWAKVPNIDPEFSYQTGNNQGIEFAALPNARVWGLNVRITP